MSLGNRIYAELGGDRVIWMIMAVLGVASILAVYSATGTIAYKERAGNTEFYLIKHTVIVCGGMFLAYLCYLLHYRQYSRAAPIFILLSVPLLVYTLAFGSEVNEARRWITLPIIELTFQTSDFAKLALVIYVARAISSKQEYIEDFSSAFVPIILPIVIICGLIAPNDLSSAILLFLTCFLMMFIGRVHWKYLILLLLSGLVLFVFLLAVGNAFPEIVRVDTWIQRFSDYLNDTDGVYQVKQAKIALANGDFFGLGPGNSTQRNFLPSPYADFIFAIIWEEYGLLGGGLIILLYVLLFFRTASLVTRSPKTFGAILAIGLSLLIVIQALMNLAVAVHLLPVTGLTLPLVSMGGTSSLFTCIAFGMILSVSRYIEKVA